jgi:AcrR family transcriptional regulator
MPAGAPTTTDQRDAVDAAYRERLVRGLAAAITEKGLGPTTVADIVRHARVSKRTFYEYFTDKHDCFAALNLALTERMLTVISRAIEAEDSWEDKVRGAARAYMETAAASPRLTRTCLLEIYAGGSQALEVRRAAYQRYAALFQRLSVQAAAERPDVRPLSPALASAIVAGVNELMLEAVEEGRADSLPNVVDTAFQLIVGAVTAPLEPR